jgi:predicted amidophosphoribosyltransferase
MNFLELSETEGVGQWVCEECMEDHHTCTECKLGFLYMDADENDAECRACSKIIDEIVKVMDISTRGAYRRQPGEDEVSTIGYYQEHRRKMYRLYKSGRY